jgi:hypothetical protein
MIDTEGFDSQYQMMFRDLVFLARSLGADGDAEDVAQEAIGLVWSRWSPDGRMLLLDSPDGQSLTLISVDPNGVGR